MGKRYGNIKEEVGVMMEIYSKDERICIECDGKALELDTKQALALNTALEKELYDELTHDELELKVYELEDKVEELQDKIYCYENGDW